MTVRRLQLSNPPEYHGEINSYSRNMAQWLHTALSIPYEMAVTGHLDFKKNAEIRFYDSDDYVGFKAPTLTANQIWALPTADGAADEYLKTDGAGNLSWDGPLGAGDMLSSIYDTNDDGKIDLAAGGTGSSTAVDARTALGLVIGTDVQTQSAVLDDLNTLGTAGSDGQFIVATGAGVFAYETTTTARTSLGIGESHSITLAGLNLGTGELTCRSINQASLLTLEIAGTPEITITGGTVTVAGDLDVGSHLTVPFGYKIFLDSSNDVYLISEVGAVLAIYADETKTVDIAPGVMSVLGTLGATDATIGGSLVLATGSITDTGGAIDFDNENLSTIGTFGCGTITLTANSDVVASGTGHITSGSEGFIVGNLTITDGSIIDADDTIAFGGAAFTGVGAIGCASVAATGTIQANGNVAFGTSVAAGTGLKVYEGGSATIPTANVYATSLAALGKSDTTVAWGLYGFYGGVLTYGAGDWTGNHAALYGQGQHYGTGTVSEMTGIKGKILIGNTLAGTITNARVFEALSDAEDGTITNLYHYYAHNPTVDNGSIGTAYQIYLAEATTAGTNWQIYSAGGNSAFGGNTRIGSTAAPTEALHFADAKNIAFDTTTGTKIGTATNQKLAFYNSTPIVKQAGVAVTEAGIHAALVNLGLIAA